MSSSSSNRGRGSTRRARRGRGNPASTDNTSDPGQSSASASSSSQPNPSLSVVMGPPPLPVGGRPSTSQVSLLRGNATNSGATPDWRVNAFFQENVERVLGRDHVGRWPDMITMINQTRVQVGENGVNHLGRAFDEREREVAARLMTWGVSNLTIQGLLGRPIVAVSPENLAQCDEWALDEQRRLEEVHGLGGFDES